MGAQRVAERDDGRHGIHDLVGEHPDELHPAVDLLVVELALDVAEGDDAHASLLEYGVGFARGEAFEAPLHLVNVCHGGCLQHVECRPVAAQHDAPLLLYHQDARVNRVEDELKILLAFHLFAAGVLQYFLHAVERGVEELLLTECVVLGETEGVVAIVDGIEHEGHLRDVASVASPQSEVGHACGQQGECQCDVKPVHRVIVRNVLFCCIASASIYPV